MPIPNDERFRLTLDLGKRGWWLMHQLLRCDPVLLNHGQAPTPSVLFRAMLEGAAVQLLDEDVRAKAPLATKGMT